MALANLSAVWGGWVAGKLDGLVSVPRIYMLCAALQLGVAAILIGIDADEVRQELGDSKD